MLSRLHYCEMVAACLLLEERGSFVLKVFTMFEDSSVVLMLLLNLMFEEVHGIKPATSKSGNSEMYLVCKGYRKNVTWKTLWDIAQATVYSREDLFLEVPHIPDAFLREHRLCCEAFARWQTGTMCRNMDLYVAMTTAARNKLQLQQEVALETFVKLTGIRYQKHLLRVGVPWREKSAFHLSRVSVHALGEGSTAAAAALWENKKLKGTFHLRQNLSAMSFHDRVRLMDYHDVRVPDSVLLCNSRLEDSEVTQWPRPECGDRPLHVLSSRICNTNLLEDFNTLLSHSDVQRHQRDTVCQHATMLADMLADKVQEYFSVESSRDPQQLLPGRVFCHQLSPSSQEHKAAPLIHVVVTECADQDSVSRRTFLNQLVKNDSVNVRSVSIDEQREMGQSSCDGGAVLFCDVIGFLSLKEGAVPSPLELVGSRRLLSTVLPILKTLPLGGHLVLLTTTFLTRLSSTLLYILARSFEATSLHGRPNLWAQQLLLLSGFRGLSPSLERHLTTAHHRLTAEEERGQSQGCLMELYSFLSLLNDRKFVQFLTAHNNYALAGLVNELLKLNKPPEEMAADGEGQQNLT
ncbi:uncharacterized protein LOC101846555 [Aplysia californica]|uniref:Cap-specific mRNA (nucleoside-2'-O-)-methyltransferase 2 n=1 Tax=Aplysia californica TaxID=6500 RepID=A0ABM1AET6_APLCA|nr:uncharacterized protein LOC101846555 [Aplysia californica]